VHDYDLSADINKHLLFWHIFVPRKNFRVARADHFPVSLKEIGVQEFQRA
jgi:hypothetical protein